MQTPPYFSPTLKVPPQKASGLLWADGLWAGSDTAAALGRERQRRMLEYFLRLVRENFMYNFRNPQLCYMTRDEENFARNFSPYVNEANVLEISAMMNRAIRDIGQNANAKIVFFDMATNLIVALIRKP